MLLHAAMQGAPPEEFETSRTAKLWAVEQLLRFCAQQDEKLVLAAERCACAPRELPAFMGAACLPACVAGRPTLH